MKFSRLQFFLSIFIFSFFVFHVPGVYADNGIYKIDFGPGGSRTNLTGWNNADESVLGSTVATLALVDSAGATSTAVMRFTDAGDCGTNTVGMTGNTLGYPDTATSDFTYGGNCGTGKTSFGLVFTGLDQAFTYNIKLYAARIDVGGPARLTVLRVGTTTSSVSALGNTSNQAIVSNITPSATSSIEFRVEQGSAGQFFYINVIELVKNSVPNNAPAADAGPDLVLSATTTSVNLAASVTDSDGTVTNTSWAIVSGPAGATFSTTTATTTTLSGLSPGKYALTLSAIDNGGASTLDNLVVTVLPPLYQAGKPAKKITFLGGSITSGTGASNIGNSWAGLYTDFAKIYNASTTLQNLGVSGYTSTDVINNSLASAGAFAPDVVIFGFTTNDGASSTMSTSTSVSNLNTIVTYFTTRNIPIWIATPSARNGLPNTNLVWMKDYILANYGSKAINFFDTYANADGSFNGSTYGSGDGVHPNDAGHTLLYKQAVAANVIETLYASTSTAPTSVAASAGNATATISWTAPSSNGGLPILYYTVTSVPGSITATTTGTSLTMSGLTNGTFYNFVVTATNGIGISATSSVSNSITPNTVPNPPTSVATLAGNAQATVSWIAPVFNGGSTLTGYKLYNASTGVVATTTDASTNSFVVTGLSNGTSYTYYVTALNATGESASSTASNAVTPVAAASTLTSYWSPGSSSGSGSIPTSLLPFIQQSVPAAYSFSRSLSIGANGPDVRALQQYLNSKGFAVALIGIGSKGKETTLFGPATKAALIRFQKSNKIPATGFFGPLTRAAIK